MRVQMTQNYHCRLGHDHRPGDVCDLPEHVGEKLIANGIAVEAVPAPVREQPEKTVQSKPAKPAQKKKTGQEEAD